ncbi:MAG: VOC family protein [Burkholderiales bacterium]|nr:VOC family protein [Burkholderiales bacterium]
MLAQPLICVADVQQTSAWFQRVLGFESDHGGPEYEQLMSGGALVLQLHLWDAHEHPHLGNPETKPYGNGVVLWFMSEAVEQDYERAVQAKAEILEPIKINPLANHLEFWLREPNGYVIVVAGPYGQLGAFAENTA